MKFSKKDDQELLNKRTFQKTIQVFLFLASTQIYSQQGNVNPAGKWFFGAECGTNRII